MSTVTLFPCLLNAITNTTSSACPLHDHRRTLIIRKPTSSSPQAARRRLINIRVSSYHKKSSDGSSNEEVVEPPPSSSLLLDRREMLIALGGMYGSSSSLSSAMADPVSPPDLSKCEKAETGDEGKLKLECCPPPYKSDKIVDYKFPSTPLRVRRAAQNVKDDEEYMSNYKEAVRLMKALPDDDPCNYYQQAKIHCAYCNDAYHQLKSTDAHIQVHYSWLFLPWHRYYVHFYERILGKLIGDDTFALPFWNFDSPDGMPIPEIFTQDKSSPLYNEKRETRHYPPAVLDYKYGLSQLNKDCSNPVYNQDRDEVILENLRTMKNTFKQSLPLAELFMGDPMRAGDEITRASSGQLEGIHNSGHLWVGTCTTPVPDPDRDAYPDQVPRADMGDFSTAARDSIFFNLHTNVDRLWEIYRKMRGNQLEFNDNDWLDAAFTFYDEDRQVVRVKVRDCLNPSKLCYTYEEVPIPWLGKLPTKKTAKTTATKKEYTLVPVSEFGSEPRALDDSTVLRVLVPRPAKQRKKREKAEKVEVLFIKDIVVTKSEPARFDVYIAAPAAYGDVAGPDYGEFAGSFVKLSHTVKKKEADKAAKGGKKERKVYLKLGITSLLEDLEIEDVEKLVVTLVPRGGEVTVGGVAIKLLQTDI